MPRISLNEFCKYLTGNPLSRESIIRKAVTPVGAIVIRYASARATTSRFISSDQDEDILVAEITTLNRRLNERVEELEAQGATPEVISSDWTLSDIRSSIEALNEVRDSDLSAFEEIEIDPFQRRQDNHIIDIAGLEISVNPDLIITKEVRGTTYKGAVKIHISRSGVMTKEAQEYAAMLLMAFVEQKICGQDEKPHKDICLSYSVFTSSVVSAPRNHKQLFRRAEAAAREILGRWEDISREVLEA